MRRIIEIIINGLIIISCSFSLFLVISFRETILNWYPIGFALIPIFTLIIIKIFYDDYRIMKFNKLKVDYSLLHEEYSKLYSAYTGNNLDKHPSSEENEGGRDKVYRYYLNNGTGYVPLTDCADSYYHDDEEE
jgi:hypothetical protein